MDNSTDGVTLLTGFVFDVLQEYEDMKLQCAPAFELAKGLDPAKPEDWCSIDIYNGVCDWIEQNIGRLSIQEAGIAIGNRAFDNIVQQGKIDDPAPVEMLKALQWAASTMIRDPKGRGWEILEPGDTSVVMRRTQTFNCMLQPGLLLSLVRRTGALAPLVDHAACTRNGDEFCEYKVTWLRPKPA